MVNFLTNIHKRHPIARPSGRAMWYILWVLPLIDILTEFLHLFYAISYYIGPCYNSTRLYMSNTGLIKSEYIKYPHHILPSCVIKKILPRTSQKISYNHVSPSHVIKRFPPYFNLPCDQKITTIYHPHVGSKDGPKSRPCMWSKQIPTTSHPCM